MTLLPVSFGPPWTFQKWRPEIDARSEAVASGILKFFFIEGINNPADVLSKHCGFPQMWPLIQPLLFWQGPPDLEQDKTNGPPIQLEGSVRI